MELGFILLVPPLRWNRSRPGTPPLPGLWHSHCSLSLGIGVQFLSGFSNELVPGQAELRLRHSCIPVGFVGRVDLGLGCFSHVTGYEDYAHNRSLVIENSIDDYRRNCNPVPARNQSCRG